MQVLTKRHRQKHADTAVVVQAMQDGSGGHGCKGKIVRDERNYNMSDSAFPAEF